MRLTRISIEGFRGFNKPRVFRMDAPVVVVYGENGSGKSSIAEAIEWLLFGEISRRERSRFKGEFTGDYLRNVHHDQRRPAFVEAVLELDDGPHVLRKEIVGKGTICLLLDGHTVEDFLSLGLPTHSWCRPILAQGEIKSFVDTEQKERWTDIARILGLEEIHQLRDALMCLRRDKDKESQFVHERRSRDACRQAIASIKGLEELLTVASDSETTEEKILAAIKTAGSGALGLELPSDKPVAEGIAAVTAGIASPKLKTLLLSHQASVQPTLTTKGLGELFRRVNNLRGQTAEVENVRGEAGKADLYAKSLELAGDVLTGAVSRSPSCAPQRMRVIP